MENSKLSMSEAVTVVFTIIISHTVLLLPRVLLNTTKSATIINFIYVSFIVIACVTLIANIFKHFPAKDILDVSEFLGGKVFKNILGGAFIAYFMFSGSILLRNFCESIRVIYFPMSNVAFVILFFVIAVAIVNKLSFAASFRTNLIIIPLTVVSILFLFFANISNFSVDRMFPILGEGFFNTFVTGIGNISAFAGIASLYFLKPLLKDETQFKKVAITSIILSAIYVLIAISTLLLMFEFFVETDEIMPLYSAARYIEFGSFFQRLEYIFLLIWMIVFACYLSIVSKFSMIIFKKLTGIKYVEPLVYPFSILMFAIALLPSTFADSEFYETTIFRYLVWFFIYAFNISLLVLAYFKLRITKKNSSDLAVNTPENMQNKTTRQKQKNSTNQNRNDSTNGNEVSEL